ncbi:unnamed protein product [Symbiodinium sp. CCMP2592]|nr:unnamed protein product [Symbiodinium sp. CCMP2592]
MASSAPSMAMRISVDTPRHGRISMEAYPGDTLNKIFEVAELRQRSGRPGMARRLLSLGPLQFEGDEDIQMAVFEFEEATGDRAEESQGRRAYGSATELRDFSLPITVCTIHWCKWTNHGEKCQDPSFLNTSDLGQVCCCMHGFWKLWDDHFQDPNLNPRKRLFKNISANVSLLAAVAADGKRTLLKNLWQARGQNADWHLGDWQAALAAAVSRNDRDAVRFLLEHGCLRYDCHGSEPSYQGVPLVIWAASLGFGGILNSLLEKKASLQVVPTRAGFEFTALTAAVFFNVNGDAVALIEDLARRPADFRWLARQQWRGKPSLFLAAEQNDQEMLKVLLQAKVSPEQTASWGEMAIHKAAYQGNLDSVKLLWKFRANVEAQNTRGATALMVAADKGHVAVTRFLVVVCKASLLTPDLWGFTPAHRVAVTGRTSCMDMLEQNHDAFLQCINQREHQGRNVLDVAANFGHEDLVKYLLPKTQDKTTALSWAVGHPKVVELLLQEVPSSISTKQADGRTALHHAAFTGSVAGLGALIRARADVGSLDNTGCSPLCSAARGAQPTAVDRLLKARAQVSSGTGDWTCLDDAASSPKWWGSDWTRSKNSTWLLARCADGPRAQSLVAILEGRVSESLNDTCRIGNLGWASLHWAVMLRDTAAIRTLSYENAGSATDAHGRTALSLAARLGLLEEVSLLAQHSELNSADETGLTPLMWAAQQGHAETCKKLLQLKADPHQRDASHNTLMHLAASSGSKEVVDVFKTSDRKTENSLGETALFSAVRSKNVSVVKHMLSELGYNANDTDIFQRTALFYSLSSCQQDVWDALSKQTDTNQRDYLEYRIDEMPEFRSSLCVQRTNSEDLWTLDVPVVSKSFHDKLVTVAKDSQFRGALLVTLALSFLLGCRLTSWNHWRASGTLVRHVSCNDSNASEESSDSAESADEREAGSRGPRDLHIPVRSACCQLVLDVSVRAVQIQTASKLLGRRKWTLLARRCLDVVALFVFPSIMCRVLAWWHMLLWCLLTCILPPDRRKELVGSGGRSIRDLLEKPARLIGSRDMWAWLRTGYLLLQFLWCMLLGGDMWRKQHEYLWNHSCYPMSELNQISRDELPIPFPVQLHTGWSVFGLVFAVGAAGLGSLWMRCSSKITSSPPVSVLYVAMIAVWGLLVMAFWPEAPATLPLSLAGILVTYRAAVFLLTVVWVVLNLPLILPSPQSTEMLTVVWVVLNLLLILPSPQSTERCDIDVGQGRGNTEDFSKVVEKVRRVAEKRRDLANVKFKEKHYFEKRCEPQTLFTVFQTMAFWLLDIYLDLQTVVIFAAAGSYIYASLILGAFFWGLFATASEGVFNKIGSALRQTVRTQVRAEEYQALLDHEASIEVPVSLVLSTYGLPLVAHRPAAAIMTVASIFMSVVNQAQWLYEEFDVSQDLRSTQTVDLTPKAAGDTSKPLPED